MKQYHYGNPDAQMVLIQLVGEHDLLLMEQEIGIIKTWALVHGMASIACMNGVHSSVNWVDPDIRLLIPGK